MSAEPTVNNEIIKALKQGSVTVETINELIAMHIEQVRSSDDKCAFPLHYACGAGYNEFDQCHLHPVEVIKALLDAYPTAAEAKDMHDRNALHFAINKGASAEIVKILVDAYPASVQTKDCAKRTPLYYIGQTTSAESVRLLFDACPAAAEVIDSYQWTPLHRALERSAPSDVVKILLEAFPAAAEVKDSDKRASNNMTPLHWALQKGYSYEIVKIVFDAYPAATEIQDESNRTPLYIAKGNVESMYALVYSDMPINSDGSTNTICQHYTWTSMLDPANKVALSVLQAVVIRIFEENLKHADKLASAKDAIGRDSYGIAHPEIKAIMIKYTKFLGRYKLGSMLHKSTTSCVISATDSHSEADSRVVLKFMKDKDQFDREKSARIGLPTNCVIPIILSFDGDTDETFVEAVSKHDVLSSEYRYLLVLPLSDKSMFDMIAHDNLCGDFNWIRVVFIEICQCLEQLHTRGRIHGDIKPLNIMRGHDGRMILIDLDASVSVSEKCLMKLSTAYLPPELFDQQEIGRLMDEPIVLATVSFDMWALGVVLYELCTGSKLWKSNNHDNIDDINDAKCLFQWTLEVKEEKLRKITNIYARNLVSQLLSKDITKRLSISHALAHPFISGKEPRRMVGDTAKRDLFLSYRVSSDSILVEKIYMGLTKKGYSVFWDKLCLKDGQNWIEGFADELLDCSVFVPILSESALKSRFQDLKEDTEDVDNVLLEHRMALEYRRRNFLKAIFPIAVGKLVNGYYSDYYASGCGPRCPNLIVKSVEAKFYGHIERQGLGSPFIPNLTVLAIYQGITVNHGAKIEGPENQFEALVDSVIDRICTLVETTKADLSSSQLNVSTSVSDRVSSLGAELAKAQERVGYLERQLQQERKEKEELLARMHPFGNSEYV